MERTRFMRLAAAIGDLGSPFYREERQRDVWNEASAVGFQLMLWLSLVAASASLWIGGRPAVPYALTMFFVAGVGSLVTIAYSHRLGVDPASPDWVTPRRLVVVSALYVVLVGGLIRSTRGSTGDSALERGLPVSFAVGTFLGLALAVRRMTKKRVDPPEPAEDA